MNKLKVLDLFSGIGGFSLGLERTGGFETVAFCEIDETCRKVLKKHWPDVPIFEDVSQIKGKTDLPHITRDYRPLKDCVDVICGGFPCQDISVAGKQKGIKGERSGLWSEFARLIKEIKPRYAIIENVANLRSNGLATVLKDLWEIGYGCEWHIIPASSVGALHKRERIWIIAYPDSELVREQSRRGCWESGESETLPRVNGEERTICDSSGIGCDGRTWEKRHLQTNKEWDDKEIHKKGKQCQFVSRSYGQILSRGAIDGIRDAYSDHWKLVSRVHRVTHGLSKGMERARKQRIKQLGNAVVPQIPELIGREILRYEGLCQNNNL